MEDGSGATGVPIAYYMSPLAPLGPQGQAVSPSVKATLFLSGEFELPAWTQRV